MFFANNIVLIILVTLCFSAQAQYFQYSQYEFTNQRVNPSMTGLTNYATVAFDFRNQKTGGDFPIRSNFISLSYPLLKSSTGRPWSGIGISLHDDRSAGIFITQEAALSYSIQVPVGRWEVLSLGFKALHQRRRVSFDGFYTGSQFVQDRGFDRSLNNGERLDQLSASYNTLSAGVYWQKSNRTKDMLGYFGLSFFDFNKPQDSFLNSATTLPGTAVLNTGFSIHNQNDLNILPELLLTYSASNLVANTGVRFQKKLRTQPKQHADRIDMLAKYVVGRSGILGIQLHREFISVGVSYDFPFLKKNSGNLGALEVALELRQLVPTPAQRSITKRKKSIAKRSTPQPNGKSKTPRENEIIKESTNELRTDSTTSIPSVEIIESQAIQNAEGSATAGTIKQQPMLVEKAVLHFAFDFNSIDIDEDTEEFLADLSTLLNDNQNLSARIVGHTDNIGSEKFNLKLSIKRAETIKDFLVGMGISPNRLIAEGKGMSSPLNNNETDQERALNRRVEIEIFDDK